MFFVLVMFLDARRDAGWLTAEHGVRGSIDGVELTCESRWWGNQWNVTGESAFPIPEKLTLFVSERGMDHGFWRDLRVGDSRFDARFFVFCDTPALLPILVGEATRGALSNTGPNRHDITLYVRDGRVKTTGITMKDDTQSIDRHLAIHRALADDHRAFLARWKQHMDAAAGRAEQPESGGRGPAGRPGRRSPAAAARAVVRGAEPAGSTVSAPAPNEPGRPDTGRGRRRQPPRPVPRPTGGRAPPLPP